MSSGNEYDVIVVGGGVAACSAGLFTARQGLDTVIFRSDDSMLSMNAHLENYPGFPEGINPEWFLELIETQARKNGCRFQEKEVDDVDRHPEGGFVVSTIDSNTFDYRSSYLIGATAGNAEYLRALDVKIIDQKHGSYVEATDGGRTDREGLYVAGGLANKPLQAVVSAGHGAEVALALLEDSEQGFAHDWIVPEGFFTDGGGPVPPGCEEISEDQQRERSQRAAGFLEEFFGQRAKE